MDRRYFPYLPQVGLHMASPLHPRALASLHRRGPGPPALHQQSCNYCNFYSNSKYELGSVTYVGIKMFTSAYTHFKVAVIQIKVRFCPPPPGFQ